MQLKRITLCLLIAFLVFPLTSSIAKPNIVTWSEQPLYLEQSSRTLELSYHFVPEDLRFLPGSRGYTLSLPGSQIYYYPGAPRVPFLSVTIPLAEGENVAFVEPLMQMELVSQPASLLATSKPLLSTNGESSPPVLALVPSLFPPTSFSVASSFSPRGRIASMKLFPIRILEQKIYLARNLKIRVGISSPYSVPCPMYDQKKSLILSPDELLTQAEELKRMQRIDGYAAEVVPLSTIVTDYEMAEPLDLSRISCFLDVSTQMRKRFESYDSDTARKIRAFLIQKLKTNSVDYLTILGDATYVPPSDYVFSTYNPDTYDRAIPTDFFYMAPSSDGVDFTLECSVGRIPVRSVQEATNYINKMKRYKKSKTKSLLDSVSLYGGDLFEDDYYGELQINHMIDQGDFLGQQVSKHFQSEGLYKRDSILESFRQQKSGFIFMSSHGRGDYLRLPRQYIDTIDILKLPATGNLPIFVSDSCLNGSWDTRLSSIRYGTDGYLPYPTSFSEALLLSEGGAIAYLGGARVNYAGMDYGFKDGVVESTRLYNTDALLHYVLSSYGQKDTTLGDIAVLGLSQFIESDMDYPGDWLLKALFGFCLLGDPTLRLPGKSHGTSTSLDITELPAIEETNTGEIPKLSMDQLNTLHLRSPAKELRFTISDYESWDAPLLYDETLLPGEDLYTFTLPKLPKSRLAVRISAASGEEKRFVFMSRFRDDLRIVPPKCFHRVPYGIQQEITFEVVSDGLLDAKDITIKVKDGELVIFEKKLPLMIPGQDYPLSFPYTFSSTSSTPSSTESKTFEFQVENNSLETFPSDNIANSTFYPTSLAIQKIGVLEDSWGEDGSALRGILWLDQINQQFLDQKKAFEINYIVLSEVENLSELDLDLLVLYNTPYFSDESGVISQLEDMVKQGSKVLVIGPTTKKIRSLLGLKTSETFTIHQGDSSFQQFRPMKSTREFFSKESYALPIFESLSPELKPLQSVLREETNLLGATDDELLYLSVHESWYFFSGLLSKLDFERKKETFTFLVDLLELTVTRN